MEQRIFEFREKYMNIVKYGKMLSDSKKDNRKRRKFLQAHAESSYENLRESYDNSITTKFGRTERRYHTFSHVLDCIDVLNVSSQSLRLSAYDYQRLFMAIAWHDSVYKTHHKTKTTNEIESAILFRSEFNDSQNYFSYLFVNDVSELIRKTDHFNTTSDGGFLNGVIRDIDLSGMGGGWQKFKFNSQLVRMEYSEFTDEEYTKGRILIFEKLLERNCIFETRLFESRFSINAKSNIKRELLSLKESIS